VLHDGSTVVEMAAQWGRWTKEEERRLYSGGWTPYIATRGGGRRAARWQNRGRGNGGGEAVGAAKQWQPLFEDGRRGLGAVRSVRLTVGAHVVFLLSLNYSNWFNFKN
jgi:hypothetical protein